MYLKKGKDFSRTKEEALAQKGINIFKGITNDSKILNNAKVFAVLFSENHNIYVGASVLREDGFHCMSPIPTYYDADGKIYMKNYKDIEEEMNALLRQNVSWQLLDDKTKEDAIRKEEEEKAKSRQRFAFLLTGKWR